MAILVKNIRKPDDRDLRLQKLLGTTLVADSLVLWQKLAHIAESRYGYDRVPQYTHLSNFDFNADMREHYRSFIGSLEHWLDEIEHVLCAWDVTFLLEVRVGNGTTMTRIKASRTKRVSMRKGTQALAVVAVLSVAFTLATSTRRQSRKQAHRTHRRMLGARWFQCGGRHARGGASVHRATPSNAGAQALRPTTRVILRPPTQGFVLQHASTETQDKPA